VAAKAAVSKGGLLRHFRSKEALVERMAVEMRSVYDALVAAGQVLAEMHDLPRKQVALTQVKASLRLADARLARLKHAGYDTEIAAPRARVTAAEAAEQGALRGAQRAEALLRTAASNEATWDRARFAPARARPGERVPEDGLLELADFSALDIVAEVYEMDLPRVREGAAAQVVIPRWDRAVAA
jgi:HlyD family secretion protein